MYDGNRAFIDISDATGVTIAGTQAAASTQFQFRCPRPLVVDEITVVALTGGTAAGPSLVFSKSLAGTGTAAGFATCTFGTNANGASFQVTTTATTFGSGDHLLLQIAAGTAASSPKVNCLIGYHLSLP